MELECEYLSLFDKIISNKAFSGKLKSIMLFLPVGNVINCDKVLKTAANLIKKTAKRLMRFFYCVKNLKCNWKTRRKPASIMLYIYDSNKILECQSP